MTSSDLSSALRAVAGGLQTPVIVILLLLLALSVLLLGSLIGEFFTERRHMKQNMPELVDALSECSSSQGKNDNNTAERTARVIKDSALLKRQKKALLELTGHEGISILMRESLAVRLLHQEKSRYERILKVSDVTAKIAPMFGLLGTLIPLGPGIIALGQGDTYTLSTSLLTAFDTTIAGLISAAAAFLISAVRRSWYSDYSSALEMAAECILEVMKTAGGAEEGALQTAEEDK